MSPSVDNKKSKVVLGPQDSASFGLHLLEEVAVVEAKSGQAFDLHDLCNRDQQKVGHVCTPPSAKPVAKSGLPVFCAENEVGGHIPFVQK
jgi:hypothetical protein